MIDSIECILFARTIEPLLPIALIGAFVSLALPVVKRLGDLGVVGLGISLLLGWAAFFGFMCLLNGCFQWRERMRKRPRRRKR